MTIINTAHEPCQQFWRGLRAAQGARTDGNLTQQGCLKPKSWSFVVRANSQISGVVKEECVRSWYGKSVEVRHTWRCVGTV